MSQNKQATTTIKTRRSFLAPTLTSLATAGVSGYMSAENQKPNLHSSVDVTSLGVVVAIGTYVAARVGKTAFAKLGLLFGGVGGGAAGAITAGTLGAVIGKKSKEDAVAYGATGAAVGGLGGAAIGAVVLAFAGAVGGFWGGAYMGHKCSEQAAMRYIFNRQTAGQTTTAAPPLKQPILTPAPR